LQRYHVAKIPVLSLCPYVPVCYYFDKLGSYSHLVVCMEHLPFYHRIDVQFFGNFGQRLAETLLNPPPKVTFAPEPTATAQEGTALRAECDDMYEKIKSLNVSCPIANPEALFVGQSAPY